MSIDLKYLRLSCGLQSQELVDFIKPYAPKYDKPLQSKAESPEVYGVQIRPDLLKKLYLKYDPAKEARKRRSQEPLPDLLPDGRGNLQKTDRTDPAGRIQVSAGLDSRSGLGLHRKE